MLAILTLVLFLSCLNPVISQSDPYSAAFSPGEEVPAVSAQINREIFLKSVPDRMTVGQPYTIVLVVTNTGNFDLVFFIKFVFPYGGTMKFFSFMRGDVVTPAPGSIKLEPGASARVESQIVPMNENVGALEISALLYAKARTQGEQASYVLVDKVSATVREIRLALSEGERMDLFGTVAVVAILAGLIVAWKYLRNRSTRFGMLVSSSLFALALSVRLPNLSLPGWYADEQVLAYDASRILYSSWVWTKDIMNSWTCFPPLFLYMQALLIYLFGNSLEMMRTAAVLFSCCTVVVAYLLAKDLFGTKVGILSGLLQAFGSYDILNARVARAEAMVLFLTLSSVYLFWKGHRSGSWKYMLASGLFLGIAFDTKYIAGPAALALVVFLFWTDGLSGAIAKKENWAWLASLALTISPVQIDLAINGVNQFYNYYQFFVVDKSLAMVTAGKVTGNSILYSAYQIFTYVLGRGGTPWLPWLGFLNLSILVLFPIVLLSHAVPSLRRRSRESFLCVLFVCMLIPNFVAGPSARMYWLVYSLPFFFIMLANLVHRIVLRTRLLPSAHAPANGLGGHRKAGFFKLAVLFLIAIFISSQLVMGIATPIADRGEMEGLQSAAQLVRDRVEAGDLIATSNGKWVSYYVGLWDMPVTEISFTGYGATNPYDRHFDRGLIDTFKPKFIIMNRPQYNMYLTLNDKVWLGEQYVLVFQPSASMGYDWMRERDWLVFQSVQSLKCEGQASGELLLVRPQSNALSSGGVFTESGSGARESSIGIVRRGRSLGSIDLL
jgi:4-amino-4-deoxy-L-arabinose transferase-like glycosyltransferase